MRPLIRYITLYARRSDRTWLHISIVLALALSVTMNYLLLAYRPIHSANGIAARLFGFALFYGLHLATFVPITLVCTNRLQLFRSFRFLGVIGLFWLLLTFYSAIRLDEFSVAALFAGDRLIFAYRAQNGIFQFLLACLPLAAFWALIDRRPHPYGLRLRGIKWSPYLAMLLLVAPFVLAVSFLPDFRHTYPRYFTDQPSAMPQYASLHRIALFFALYAFGFVAVELFFRGFALQVLRPWLSYDAIVFAAAVYCLIHFQKPLLETVSSFFGALLLGLIAMRTGSIVGGIAAHVGLAWMMELAGHFQIVVLKNLAAGRLF